MEFVKPSCFAAVWQPHTGRGRDLTHPLSPFPLFPLASVWVAQGQISLLSFPFYALLSGSIKKHFIIRGSQTLLSPAYLAHKTQHKGQLPLLRWQKLSLHSPSCGWKARIGLWLGESPVPPEMHLLSPTAWAQVVPEDPSCPSRCD